MSGQTPNKTYLITGPEGRYNGRIDYKPHGIRTGPEGRFKGRIDERTGIITDEDGRFAGRIK